MHDCGSRVIWVGEEEEFKDFVKICNTPSTAATYAMRSPFGDQRGMA